MTRLLLWRHAATPYNADRRLQGSLDVAVDAEGLAQASHAADLVHRTYGAVAVYTSPLVRASATAAALVRLTGDEAMVDDRLTQRSYGLWEGMTWDQIREQYPREYAQRMRYEDPDIDGWDPAQAVAARVAQALRGMASTDGTAVAVSHGSSISLGLLALLELPLTSRVFARLRHANWVDLRQAADGVWQVHGYNLGADWS